MGEYYIYIYYDSTLVASMLIMFDDNVAVNITDLEVGKILAVRDHKNPFNLYKDMKSRLEGSPWDVVFKVKVLKYNQLNQAVKVKLIERMK